MCLVHVDGTREEGETSSFAMQKQVFHVTPRFKDANLATAVALLAQTFDVQPSSQ